MLKQTGETPEYGISPVLLKKLEKCMKNMYKRLENCNI